TGTVPREPTGFPSRGRTMRLLCAAALSLSLGLLAVGQEKKDPPRDDARAAKFKGLKKRFDEGRIEYGRQYQDAKTAADKAGVQGLMKELSALTAAKAVALAAENPKDAVALDAAEMALQLMGSYRLTGPDVDKATAVVVEHHL